MRPEASEFIGRIQTALDHLGRSIRVMEVCGTHTHAIGKGGLRSLFPPGLDLVSGPGCPVCVTAQGDIEAMLELARQPELTLCTFGDMMRVPGMTSSLEKGRAAGADVRVVYSALECLDMALARPERQFVFLAVGFETTAPSAASFLIQAKVADIRNLTVYSCCKWVLPAMRAVMEGPSRLDGFLTPGHVSIIIGPEAYDPIVQAFQAPCVVTGFEPLDILEGLAMVAEAMADGRAVSLVQYNRVVKPGGNAKARALLAEVFEVSDAVWRGIGVIPESGMRPREEFADYDATRRFGVTPPDAPEPPGCRCGDVLRGLIHPPECPLFRKRCTPRNPVGPCMVSSEGSCAARYKYG